MAAAISKAISDHGTDAGHSETTIVMVREPEFPKTGG
jgi:hypothetical protein